MKRKAFMYLLVLSLSILTALACSPGTGSTPTSPLLPDLQPVNNGQANPIGHNVWMSGQVSIDPASLEYQVIPDRQSNTHYNVLGWLESFPCSTCFQITGISPSGTGTLLVGIKVSHPFTNLNLTGFDVRAIAMFNGSKSFPASALTASSRSLGNPELVNADGFITLYNPTTAGSGPNGLQGYQPGKLTKTTPNALLNGFKRLFSASAGNTRNALLAGDSATTTFEIDKPAGPLVFGYAVDANWAPPVNKPVNDPMTDFGPNANCPEPWKVVLTEEKIGDGLTNDGGSTKLVIDVYDYTGKDSHASPKVECSELFDGILTASLVQDFGGYAKYDVTVANTKLAGVGTYMALVKVVDDDDATAPAWLDLTSYQIIKLGVISLTKLPPVALASADLLTPNVGQTVHFSDNASYDPDGSSITKFEWDWNNDGTYDQQGASVNHTFSAIGVYQVQFRVTDDETATDTLDTPLSITIKGPPIANAQANPMVQNVGVAVNFHDNGSNDPDGGTLTKYEWDWNNDGTFDQQGANVNHTFSAAGIYPVQFRVTDDEGKTDTLDTPLAITINAANVAWNNTIKDMLNTNCGSCHVQGSSGGVSFKTYASTMKEVVAGVPMSSLIYTTIYQGSHFGQLSATDLDTLYNWILNGAPEN